MTDAESAAPSGGRPKGGATPRGVALVTVSIVSVQFGAAIAKEIIDIAGPIGTVFYRVLFAAIVLCAVTRPAFRGRSRSDWTHIVVFGVALAGMNVCYYAALQHLPLGVTVTIEFIGPLSVAILGTRRRIDIAWALLAGAGLVLLSPIAGVELKVVGVLLAVTAGAFWAGYILISARVGERFDGLSGLALALVVSSAITAIPAVATAGTTLLQGRVIVIGLVVALLSSAIPYGFELEALRSLKPSSVAMLMSLEPVVAAMAGAVVLSEHLGAPELIAIGFVLVANVGAVATRRQGQPLIDEIGSVVP